MDDRAKVKHKGFDQLFEQAVSRAAHRMSNQGFDPPYAGLFSIDELKPFSVDTPYGQVRFYHVSDVPVNERGESTVYIVPMETYRRIRAQKAAAARWQKKD